MPSEPAPESISGREHYSVDPLAGNPTRYTVSDPYFNPSPTSFTNFQAEPSEQSTQNIRTQSTESVEQITQTAPLSPTPSEIVLDEELELEDMRKLARLNRETMENWVDVNERKERLKNLRHTLEKKGDDKEALYINIRKDRKGRGKRDEQMDLQR